jgi:hypothetical protein
MLSGMNSVDRMPERFKSRASQHQITDFGLTGDQNGGVEWIERLDQVERSA